MAGPVSIAGAEVETTAQTLDGGGGSASNALFEAHSSFHQPQPVGFSSNSRFLNSGGFLQSSSIESGATDDTDGDGLSDWDELSGKRSDPLAPTSYLSADSDNDGVSDGDEVLAGTNPNDASSQFAITAVGNRNGFFEFAWNARGGRTYTLWSANSVTGLFANPALVMQATPTGTGSGWDPVVMTYSNAISNAQLFYRVETQ